MGKKPTINHDQEEPQFDRSPFPWWQGVLILGILWPLAVYLGAIDWLSIGLGAMTALVVILWFFDWYGYENLTKSWRQPPRY